MLILSKLGAVGGQELLVGSEVECEWFITERTLFDLRGPGLECALGGIERDGDVGANSNGRVGVGGCEGLLVFTIGLDVSCCSSEAREERLERRFQAYFGVPMCVARGESSPWRTGRVRCAERRCLSTCTVPRCTGGMVVLTMPDGRLEAHDRGVQVDITEGTFI